MKNHSSYTNIVSKNCPQLYSVYKKIMSSNIGKRMASGAFWSFSGTAIAKLIVLISGIICARILGQQEFGQFGMVRSTINMFVVFGVAGMGMTATKFISQYKSENPNRICSIYLLTSVFSFVTGIIVTSIVFFISPYLANEMLHAPEIEPSIKIAALLLFVTILNGAQSGTLSGFENFKGIAINNFIGSTFESCFMIIGAITGGVVGALLGYGLGYVALYISNQISIRKSFKSLGLTVSLSSLEKQDLRLILTFSLPAALASLLTSPVYWIVRTMIVNNNGFMELAQYEAAEQWRIIILFIPSTISNIALPILASINKQDTSQFWKVLKYNIILNASIALFIAILVSSASPFIMNLYGNSYSKVLVLILLSFSTVFSSASSVIGVSIVSRGKMWNGFLFNLIWALLLIIFSYFFIHIGMGATGAALAILIAYLAHCVYQFIYLHSTIKN